ncbi:hypothetical protein TWF481_011404 [Arthrobotrys musiformis]|uniref:Transmembrane protein 188 n=1 Tax=Arthrobotrys musiformis TaxID=47236 RepID=A0AAV9W179_9PEZI
MSQNQLQIAYDSWTAGESSAQPAQPAQPVLVRAGGDSRGAMSRRRIIVSPVEVERLVESERRFKNYRRQQRWVKRFHIVAFLLYFIFLILYIAFTVVGTKEKHKILGDKTRPEPSRQFIAEKSGQRYINICGGLEIAMLLSVMTAGFCSDLSYRNIKKAAITRERQEKSNAMVWEPLDRPYLYENRCLDKWMTALAAILFVLGLALAIGLRYTLWPNLRTKIM